MQTMETMIMNLLVVGVMCLSLFTTSIIIAITKDKLGWWSLVLGGIVFLSMVTLLLFGLVEIGWIEFPPQTNLTVTNLTRIN